MRYLFIALFVITPFLAIAEDFPFTGIVQVGNQLNVRSAPNLEAKPYGRLKNGDRIVVIGEDGEYYKIQYPKQLQAWIASWLLLDNGKNKVDVVARNDVNVRSGPDLRYTDIAKLAKGTKVQIFEVNSKKWAQINPPTEAVAWLSKKYVMVGESLAKTLEREKSEKEAKKLLKMTLMEYNQALKNQYISDEAYQRLKNLFDKTIQINPQSIEAQQAKNYQVRLADFRHASRIKDMKKEEDQRYAELQEKLKKEYENKLNELKKSQEKPVSKFQHEGWLDDIGGILFRPATHRLKRGNKTLAYLKSSTIDLDEYVGKRIGINGTSHRFRGWGKIIDVSEIGVLYDTPSQFYAEEE